MPVMEKFQEARSKAKRNLQVADHMVYMTYSLVKDPKLLLVALENIFLALTNAMSSALHYENLFKRVPQFPENFEAKLALFRDCIVSRYGIKMDYLDLMRDVKDIIIDHRKSPMEFVRNERFVICSGDYSMRVLSVEQVKRYLAQTRHFVKDMNNLTSQDEGIFARSS
jgi:hypothetical protein